MTMRRPGNTGPPGFARNEFFETLGRIKRDEPRRYAEEVSAGLQAQVARYEEMKEKHERRCSRAEKGREAMPEQDQLNFDARAEQRKNLDRVSTNISQHVAAFCRDRFRRGRAEFHMADLTAYVGAHSTIAPDSAGRILRDLRRRRVVSYEVVNRAQSLYRVTAVASVQ